MKKYLFLLVFIFMTNYAYADSKVSAMTEDTTPSITDNIYEIKDPTGTPLSRRVSWTNALLNVGGITINGLAGNVGINSTTPTQRLDVGGNIKASIFSGSGASLTNLQSNQISGVIPIANLATGTPDGTKFVRDDGVLASPSGSGTVNSGSINKSAVYASAGTAVSSSNIITDNGTNVGISTVGPTQKLEINGTVKATAFIGDGSGLTGISSGGSGGWTDGGSNIYETTTTDSVGIGTTTPNVTTLEIVKQTGISPLKISSSPSGDGDYLRISSAGNVGIGTTIASSPLLVNKTATFNGQLNWGTLVTAPTSAPSGVAASAGSPNGTYTYKVTYCTSTNNRTSETTGSSASGSVVLTSQRATVTIPVSPDSRVTCRRVYRTLTGGSTYYFDVAQADNTTTTVTDNISDATLALQTEIPSENTTTGTGLWGTEQAYMLGTQNTSFGYQAGDALSSGTLNAFFGNNAGSAVTTGTRNNAFGDRALALMTSGTGNNAFGSQALGNTSTGTHDAAFGHGAVYSNTTGSENTGFGYQPGHHNVDGSKNSWWGTNAGFQDSQSQIHASGGHANYMNLFGWETNSNQSNTFIFGTDEETWASKFGLNVPYPEYKISISGDTNQTIGVEDDITDGTAGRSLTILGGKPTVLGKVLVLNTAPTAGGSGYIAGDECKISTGNNDAWVYINSASGGVASQIYLMNRGTGYSTGTGQATGSCATLSGGGVGTGMTVNITTVTASATDLAGGDANIKGGSSSGTGTSNVIFSTATNGSTGTTVNAPSEKMRILGSGFVGIGTVNPTNTLQVSGSVRATDFYSGDNTQGITTSCGGASITALTIKDGLITACTGT